MNTLSKLQKLLSYVRHGRCSFNFSPGVLCIYIQKEKNIISPKFNVYFPLERYSTLEIHFKLFKWHFKAEITFIQDLKVARI